MSEIAHETPPPPRLLRAALTGMCVGSLLSVCNIYSGLKVGWSANMSVTGALLGYAVWRLRSRSAMEARPFGILDTNLAQTAASSAAAVSSAGLVAGIPALAVLTGIQLPWPQLSLWVFGVCLLGIVIAVPLRKQMIVAEPLPFPMGIACAETLKQIYSKGAEAMARVKALGIAAAVAGAVKVAEHLKWVSSVAFGGKIGSYSLKNLTFAFDPALLLVGIGGMMGARAAISTLLGSLLAYGVIAPYLLSEGMVMAGAPDKGWYKPLVAWLLWPGVTLMVTSSLTSLALSWRTLLRGLTGLASGSGRDSGEQTDKDEVPTSWLLRLALLAAVLMVGLQIVFFGIPWWAAMIGVLLSGVLAVVAARVAGETGVTPVGAMGKVTQLVMGAALPGNVAANLMTANVTGGSASQCADLMNDLKTGHVLGAPARQQMLAQLAGAVAGALVGSAVYLILIVDPLTQLMTAEWPAPAVVTWKTVAEVFQQGLGALPRGAGTAMGIAAVAGILLAIGEAKAPERFKKFLPSPAAIGLTFVVPANQGIALFFGGLIGMVLGKVAPNAHSRFWIAICSGAIAGEGLIGSGLSIYAITAG